MHANSNGRGTHYLPCLCLLLFLHLCQQEQCLCKTCYMPCSRAVSQMCLLKSTVTQILLMYSNSDLVSYEILVQYMYQCQLALYSDVNPFVLLLLSSQLVLASMDLDCLHKYQLSLHSELNLFVSLLFLVFEYHMRYWCSSCKSISCLVFRT